MPIFLTTSTNWHVVKLPKTKYFNHASKGPVQLMRFTMVLSAQFSANKKKEKKKKRKCAKGCQAVFSYVVSSFQNWWQYFDWSNRKTSLTYYNINNGTTPKSMRSYVLQRLFYSVLFATKHVKSCHLNFSNLILCKKRLISLFVNEQTYKLFQFSTHPWSKFQCRMLQVWYPYRPGNTKQVPHYL